MSKVTLTYLQDGSIAAVAQENIEAGLVVENCPVLKLTWPVKYHSDPSIVNYAFIDKTHKDGGLFFFPLGWGMLYRQNTSPNCSISLSEDKTTLIIQANQDITAGNLLTIDKNSITPDSNNSAQRNKSGAGFSEEDLGDDEEFMKKMAELLEKQNKS